MLPSSGYFKNVVCPFYRNGFCERPHCHFGHIKAEPLPFGRSVLGRCLPDTNVLDVFDKVELQSTSLEHPTLLNHQEVGYERNVLEGGYIPTPVGRGVPPAPSILKKHKVAKYPLSSVPEYRPTPISRLKPLGAPDSSEENSLDSSNLPNCGKKRKKVEEYDPTEVKCSFKKKKVSFNLPEDNKEDCAVNDDELPIKTVPCVSLDSSDDEDSGITPQFSDDDYEEEHISDDADDNLVSEPVIEIKKQKADVTDFEADVTDLEADVLGDSPTAYTNSEDSAHISKVGDLSLVGKTQVAEVNEAKGVHKPPVKPTSVTVSSDLKAEKSHKSEIKIREKSNSNKPKKVEEKSKQEKSLDSLSHPVKEEKFPKDSSKQHITKKENLSSKHHVKDRQRTGGSSGSSNKSSEKLPEKKNHQSHHQNKVLSATKSQTKEVQKQNVKSENYKIEQKDKLINKHKNDSIKHKTSSKSSERDSKNSPVNKNLKSHSKDHNRSLKTKETVKIQDEKVSSSCQANHKKTVSSEKRVTNNSSPTNKRTKLKTDDKTTAKPKSFSSGHNPSQDKGSVQSESKNNIHKEVECEEEESLQDGSSPKSLSYAFDSDDDVHLPASDSDMDSDTLEECYRIFHEDTQGLPRKNESVEEVKDEKKENSLTQGKKRVAHQLTATTTPKVPKQQPHQVNPTQAMHNRYLKLQGMYAHQNAPDEKKVSSSFVNSTSKGIETYKKRITIAPSADLIAAVTKKQKSLQSSYNNSSARQRSPSGEITYVVTETKRVAHIPSQVLKPRPIIPVEYGCKVPSNVRQRYLNNFIDECLKFTSDEEEAYQISLEEEKKAYDRSSNKTVYLNVAVNTLKRLRTQAVELQTANLKSSSPPPEHTPMYSDARMKNKSISHEMMLGGARAQRTSFSIEKKKPKIDMEIKGKMLYDSLMEYVLTTDQLVEHGFPLPHPAEPGRALVSGVYVAKRTSSTDRFKRVCCRCQKSYQVDENSEYIKKEECEYHWGHLWQKRIGRSMERQYSCCGGDSQSDGCCIATGHVIDGDESEMLKGFVKTLPKPPPPDGYFGVYALDCEMCYTSVGIELIRVTVINPDMKAVYETFVKPENRILDYNTRFSGITEEDLKDVETTLRDVQAVLLCLFNSKTVLIGHSLESDFKALKLIHTTVVDTSVVFPHKRGLPYKRALRTLMAEHLRKIIQNSLTGHDSNEDAVACLELMLWKIKEDLKRSR